MRKIAICIFKSMTSAFVIAMLQSCSNLEQNRSSYQQARNNITRSCRAWDEEAQNIKKAAHEISKENENAIAESYRQLQKDSADSSIFLEGMYLSLADEHAAERASGLGVGGASSDQIAAERRLSARICGDKCADERIEMLRKKFIQDVVNRLSYNKTIAYRCWNQLGFLTESHQDFIKRVYAEINSMQSKAPKPDYSYTASPLQPPLNQVLSNSQSSHSSNDEDASRPSKTWMDTPYAPMVPPVMRDRPIEETSPIVLPVAR